MGCLELVEFIREGFVENTILSKIYKEVIGREQEGHSKISS